MDWLSFTLLNVDRRLVSRLRQTTSLDTFKSTTKDFHPEGLYAPEIYGPIGSEQRDVTFSYIDINLQIISPVIALTLFDLKRLYKEIMSGNRHAVWDASVNDFIPAAPTDAGADTGYSFFMSHYNELKPKETKSLIRQQSINLFNRFRDIALSRYVLVIPAGLRDLEVKDGREQEDEINKLYRQLLSTAKLIPNIQDANNKITDTARWKLQETFNAIYKLLFDFLDGKKGYIRGKLTYRRVTNGTRNVLSSQDASSPVMGRADAIRPTDTIIGMMQGLKALLPLAINAIRTTYLPHVDAGNGALYLINKKTLRREMTFVRPEDYDLYTSDEGMEKLINSFQSSHLRQVPIVVQDHYLALIYNDGKKFKIFYDISELPAWADKKYVKPITLTELLYLSGYDRWNDYFMVITRFPVAGQGSTYPSTIRMTTTSKTSMLYELTDDWQNTKPTPAIDFPDRTCSEFITSMAPHPSRLKFMQADFDGDTGSGESVYTDEALEENRNMMNKASFWVAGNGDLLIQVDTDLIERTMANLLADPL